MQITSAKSLTVRVAMVSFDPVFRARPLKLAIQQRIENPVAKLILEGKFGPKDVIPVDVQEGEFVFGRVVH
jgi:ATP-dependent Clp protease ATP-binding subunit ClpB